MRNDRDAVVDEDYTVSQEDLMGAESDLDKLIADPDALMSDALLEADQAQRVESSLPTSVRETHRRTLLRWLTVAG